MAENIEINYRMGLLKQVYMWALIYFQKGLFLNCVMKNKS